MNHRTLALVGCLALAAPGVLAVPQRPLVPVDPDGRAAAAPLAPAPQGLEPHDAAEWRRRLTAADLDQRERELDRFLPIAREDADARALLEDWADDVDAPELAWTARLALRELDRGAGSAPTPPALNFGPGLGLRGDPFAGLLGGSWGDFQRELERLRSMFGDLQGSGAARSSTQGFELSVTPDGVKCRVRETVDGVEQTREYEAGSLEELLEANPELRDRVQLRERTADDVWGERFPTLDRLLDPRRGLVYPPSARGAGELRTDVLGVHVHPLGEEDAARLGVAPGEGLVVLRTEPGTIAAALGIQRGHVLLSVNGTAATGGEAVSEALCNRPEDGEVRVELIDSWGQRRARTWRPQEELEDALRRGLAEGRRF